MFILKVFLYIFVKYIKQDVMFPEYVLINTIRA